MGRPNETLHMLVTGFSQISQAFDEARFLVQLLAGEMILNRRTRKAMYRLNIAAATFYLKQHINRRCGGPEQPHQSPL